MTLRPFFGLALLLVACGGSTSGGGLSDGGAGYPGSGGFGTGGTDGGGFAGSGGIAGSGGVPSGGTGGTTRGCGSLSDGMNDQFVLVASATVKPDSPLLFRVTSSASANEMTWLLEPLDAKDRTTPVAAPIALAPIQVAPDGSFDADPPPLDLPGTANPISGSNITVDIQSLRGSVCGVQNFYCGVWDGAVSKPIPLDLKNSTWTLTRMSAAQGPPLINCAKEPAGPPPP